MLGRMLGVGRPFVLFGALILLLACMGAAQEAAPIGSSTADFGDRLPAEGDPASLYARCKTRVEGMEVDGECGRDADCATAGCSGEICVSNVRTEGLMGTCDHDACFAVLDRCGCRAGRCSWSLKSGAPAAPGHR